jgi:hypothetical protein
MKINKQNQSFILFAILIVGLSLIMILFLRELTFPDSGLVFNDKSYERVRAGSFVIQEFTAKRDGLSGIKINIEKINQKPGDFVLFKLLGENCEGEIVEKRVASEDINPLRFYNFKFKRLVNSKDKKLCLKITNEANKKEESEFSIMVSEESEDVYLKDVEKNKGMLIMRPSYNNESFLADLTELSQRLSQYKPWFYKKYYWPVVFVILVVSTISLGKVLIKK